VEGLAHPYQLLRPGSHGSPDPDQDRKRVGNTAEQLISAVAYLAAADCAADQIGGSARGYRDFATPYAIRTATLAPVAETPGERFERCHFESVLDL
jgi:hypothetical protein